jgi:phospholipid/cholesterol/gamma-HCH transport system substrate-binding protein
MRVSREFKLGILVVLSLLLFFVAFNFLKEFGTFGKAREFSVEFDKSHGLQVHDEVLMNGVKIGKVNSVDVNEFDASKIIVQFSVSENDLVIPRVSQLWLISTDILGTKALDLRVPHDSLLLSNFKTYRDGDFFNSDYVNVALSLDKELEGEFMPIKDKTNELITRVEDIIVSVSAFWDSSAAYTFDESMYDTRGAIEQYKEMSSNLHNLVTAEVSHLSFIKKDFIGIQDYFDRLPVKAQISSDVNTILKHLHDTTFSDVANETGSVFSNLDLQMRRIKEGKGSVGRMTNTSELSDRFKLIDSSLTELMDHLEARPKDFYGFSIFGLKARGYDPGKKKKPLLDGMLDSLDNGKKIDYQ